MIRKLLATAIICSSVAAANAQTLTSSAEGSVKDLILDEAYRDITIREGHRSVTIPMAQAVMRSLAVNATKGQHRSQRLFSELLASVESSRKILHDQWLDTAITYKVEWEKELRCREQLGITDLPDLLPHTSPVG